MPLYIIGLGLGDEKDITLKGAEAIKKCDRIFLEAYTSILGVSTEKLVRIIFFHYSFFSFHLSYFVGSVIFNTHIWDSFFYFCMYYRKLLMVKK